LTGKDKDKDKKPDDRTDDQKKADLHSAVSAGQSAFNAPGATPESVQAKLPPLKTKYKLVRLELEKAGTNEYDIIGEINPIEKSSKKKFDPTKVKKGDQVRVKMLTEGFLDRKDNFDEDKYRWPPAEVIDVEADAGRFKYRTKKKGITGLLYFADFEKSWRESQPGIQYKVDAEWDKIKDLDSWPDYNDARQVLNYRHHKQFNNPGGLEWHHIVERSAGGPNSVVNLALTTAALNASFNQWYAKPQDGTGGVKLRQFLKGKPPTLHRWWMVERCFKVFGVSIKPMSNERGKYQTLG